jgi:hypothetical protein
MIFSSPDILISFLFMTSVNAAVLGTRSSLESRTTTQSCHALDHGVFASYSVWIGVPYGGSKACDNTYDILEYNNIASIDTGCRISSWQCVKANDGNTQLWFDAARDNSACINGQLHKAYPDVNSFNCPDY